MYIDDRSKGYMVKPVKWPGNFSGLRPRRRLGLEILVACEGRASGVSCRVRRPIWQPIGYPAAPTHPPHAIGTRGPLGDQITSIEASFDFSVQRSLKYPHVRPQNGQLRDRVSPRKWTLPPSPVMGRTKGPHNQNRRRPSGWELESQIRRPPPYRHGRRHGDY